MINAKKIILLIVILLSLVYSNAFGIDFWQYPEMADKHAVFGGCFPLSFTISLEDWPLFEFYYPEIFFDYILPFGFPLSLGISMNYFNPDLRSYSFRAAYHINCNNENLDVYVLYTLGFYNERPRIIYLQYGGRAGFRWRFGSFFCLTFETGFMLEAFYVGFSIKIN